MKKQSFKYKKSTVWIVLLCLMALPCFVGIVFGIGGFFIMDQVADKEAQKEMLNVVAAIIALISLGIPTFFVLKIIGVKRHNKKTDIRLLNAEYPFPCHEYYKLCKTQGISAINDDFTYRKAVTLAQSFMAKDVPQKFWHIYTTKEQLENYFRLGSESNKIEMQRVAEQQRQARVEQEIQFNTPQDVKLGEKESEWSKLNFNTYSLSPLEKRTFLYKEKIERTEREIKSIEAENDALFQLANAVAGSAHQEKTYDWALIGGIASGLGGTGAGIAAAADAMQKNAQIEAQNAANQAYANNLAYEIRKAAITAPRKSTDGLEKELQSLQMRLPKLSYKVYMDDMDTQTLFNNLVCTPSVEKHDDCLEVKITIENKNTYSAPKGVYMSLDGALDVVVYGDGIFIDRIPVVFEEDGLELGKTATIHNYLTKTLSGNDRKYTFNITPINLWLMEK